MPIASELLSILACPKCKGDIALIDQGQGLVCEACQVVYPVRDDIPIMLIEESVPLAGWKDGQRQAKS